VYEAAKANKWFIHELGIKENHVHMMIQLPPTISVAEAIMHLKGGTSKVIRQEFPELKEFLWGDSLWQDGYFAESNGRIDEKALRDYIKRQWEQE
jgi:putative transposase